MAASRSFRNKNPGNLRASKWVQSLPGYLGHDSQQFAMFTDWTFGLCAMIRLLRGSSYRWLSIRDAITRYAPKSENDTASYITTVCKRSGLMPDQVIDGLTLMEFMDLVKAMIEMEGWHEG